MNFPHLFSPLEIRGKRLKNRIMSSGHDTSMPTDNLVNEPLVAYHRARARGGAGLIVMQVAGVHDSARYTSHVLMATDDACIPGYRRVAEACHAEGCVVLSQIFHPGREIMESADGLLAVAYSASASPNERFRVMPRELDQPLIDEIVAGYAAAARRLHQAGLDGVEVVASHGYLPAQFLNPRVNRRTDGYNGDLDARLRFLREVLAAVPSVRPDVSVIHAQKADRKGNVLLWGILGVQKEAALAAKRCIVTVEEIVDELDAPMNACVLPSWALSAVCLVPGGAHPSYAHGYYERDNRFYQDWDPIARDRESFTAWIDAYIRGTEDFGAFQAKLAEGKR